MTELKPKDSSGREGELIKLLRGESSPLALYHVNCRVGVDLSSFAPFISLSLSLSFPSLFLLVVTTERIPRHRLSRNGK